METMTIIGVILLIVGIVFSPFTCFTSLLLSALGVVLIIIGEKERSPYPPQYPQQYPPQYYPQYPQQYPPQQPAQPKRMCPSCGREIQFNAVACQYCGYDFTRK